MKNKARISVLLVLSLLFFFLPTYYTNAQYGPCSEYGAMAYEDYSGYCKCVSGYVFQDTPYLGTQCVFADSVCKDEYGTMSRYNSLSNSCECRYGYVLGKDSIGRTQCISESESCQNQLGYNSSASLGGGCECDYGYVIDGGQCVDGDRVCRSDHGINSSYNSLSNRCECDDDYTLDDDNQCVEKQHNVYFRVLDINPDDDKELIVKSNYNSRMYKIRLGVGCFSTSVSRYESKNLVINLGTDYEVDMFDIVVLQDHSQTCSIMHKEKTYDGSFPEPEEENHDYYYAPQPEPLSSRNVESASSNTEPAATNVEPQTEEVISIETEATEDNLARRN